MLEFDVDETLRDMRVLHFDCECRPLAWYGGDFVTKQPTVISWQWAGAKGKPTVMAIGESDRSSQVVEEERMMVEAFTEVYNQADVVTGHFIRGFDLPLVNASRINLGLTPLEDKLTSDTKNDFVRRHGMSMSQENLGAVFEMEHPKVPSNNLLWERANMLIPSGIKWAKSRCVGDVVQHMELRTKMLAQNLLAPPQEWSSQSKGGTGKYHA